MKTVARGPPPKLPVRPDVQLTLPAGWTTRLTASTAAVWAASLHPAATRTTATSPTPRHMLRAGGGRGEARRGTAKDEGAAGTPGRGRARPPRPRKRGAVRLGRVGSGEHQCLRLLVLLARPELTQPLDRAGQRELRAAEALDEVAAAARAQRLQGAQLAVDGAVPAGDPLSAHAVAGDDPLPLEEELGERAPLRPLGEQPIRRRPPPLRRRYRGGAG